ncbi:zinc-binding dehydrogenase [Bradyrhizobium sp. S3.2.12]|uniref:zinc-binding dehydrogenase n=1 Tax=Bradyrhizobium sp. S3.2.12 TaxID=3156387 RepID=UPI003398FF49
MTEPSQDRAKSLGVTAMRYTVEPDGEELAKIGKLAENDKLKPHIQATFPLEQAAQGPVDCGARPYGRQGRPDMWLIRSI